MGKRREKKTEEETEEVECRRGKKKERKEGKMER